MNPNLSLEFIDKEKSRFMNCDVNCLQFVRSSLVRIVLTLHVTDLNTRYSRLEYKVNGKISVLRQVRRGVPRAGSNVARFGCHSLPGLFFALF